MPSQHSLAFALGALLVAASSAHGFTLFSTKDSYLGPGVFVGPGANPERQTLFATVIRDIAFVSPLDFVTPFSNNGKLEPNICAEREVSAPVDGRLSNGLAINESVDTCSMVIGGTRFLTAVVDGGPYRGEQRSVTLEDGEVVIAFDFALDLGIGEKGVVHLPFYGTTGSVTVPFSVQTQSGEKGVDQAGAYPSGTVLTGRIGDFNGDGWIDGTFVAAGVMPLDSPVYPGQPFALYRYFETDIPIDGVVAGDLRSIAARASKQRPK